MIRPDALREFLEIVQDPEAPLPAGPFDPRANAIGNYMQEQGQMSRMPIYEFGAVRDPDLSHPEAGYEMEVPTSEQEDDVYSAEAQALKDAFGKYMQHQGLVYDYDNPQPDDIDWEGLDPAGYAHRKATGEDMIGSLIDEERRKAAAKRYAGIGPMVDDEDD